MSVVADTKKELQQDSGVTGLFSHVPETILNHENNKTQQRNRNHTLSQKDKKIKQQIAQKRSRGGSTLDEGSPKRGKLQRMGSESPNKFSNSKGNGNVGFTQVAGEESDEAPANKFNASDSTEPLQTDSDERDSESEEEINVEKDENPKESKVGTAKGSTKSPSSLTPPVELKKAYKRQTEIQA